MPPTLHDVLRAIVAEIRTLDERTRQRLHSLIATHEASAGEAVAPVTGTTGQTASTAVDITEGHANAP